MPTWTGGVSTALYDTTSYVQIGSSSMTDTTAGGNDGVWSTWTWTGNATTMATTWTIWCTDLTSNNYTVTVRAQQPPPMDDFTRDDFTRADGSLGSGWEPIPLSDAEDTRARLRDLHRQAEVAREQRGAAAAAAIARAEELLRDHLTAEQAAQLIQSDAFDLITATGRRYKVKRGYAGNVYLVERGRETRRYCIHPDRQVPDADAMLAQKLLLETDEAAFLRIANETVLA